MQFFEDTLSGTKCDRNWMEGAFGSAEDRPNFHRPAPALLGFDSAIWEYCSEMNGFRDLKGFSQQELAARCVQSSNNILRLIEGRWVWTMCQNLVWQVCAITGKLPGQDGQLLRFANDPKQLQLDEWEHPNSWPCKDGQCPTDRYSVGDVFFAELAIFRWLCRNAGTLLEVDRGRTTICALDPDAFRSLVQHLMAP